MFPLLHLPRWIAESLPVCVDENFLDDVTYSSICGYYYTRLIDNFMDADIDVRNQNGGLLPVTGILVSEFQFIYQAYFPPQHEFWDRFRTNWRQAAESAGHDAALTRVDEEEFQRISSRKFCAAAIPVTATCYYCRHPEVVEAWDEVVRDLGRWSQMFDDLLDWHQDKAQGRATWFLTEAEERRGRDRSLAHWVIHDGGPWAFDLLRHWTDDLRELATRVGSPGLEKFLHDREALMAEKERDWKRGFAELDRLAEILQAT